MRLLSREVSLIKEKVNTVFGEASIYLFGSRMDDMKQGGDIDLFIVPKNREEIFRKKMKIKTVLEDILYKPVDIVVAKNKNRLIEQEAYKGLKLI